MYVRTGNIERNKTQSLFTLEGSQLSWRRMFSKLAIMQPIISKLEYLGTTEKRCPNSAWRESGNVSLCDAWGDFEGWLGVHQVNKVGGIFYVVPLKPGRCVPPEAAYYGSLQGLRTYIQPQSREWESSHGANIMASKVVASIKSREGEVTVRKGELVLKSITTLSKAVNVREWFRLRLWKRCICLFLWYLLHIAVVMIN